MTDNLALWELVCKTDPAHVKAITGKPYKGTSPKPYWVTQEATRAFGPCGIGWGYQIVSERVEDGAPGDKVHIAHIRLWYIWGGKRGELDHIGQTMFAGKNKNGPYTDEDAPKKSVTDALVKALSMVGFAGDIFMGRYDDSKYVNEVRREFEERHSEQDLMSEKAFETMMIVAAQKAENEADLVECWRNNIGQMKALGLVGDHPTAARITKIFADRRAELTQPKEAA